MLQDFTGTKGLSPQSDCPRGSLSMAELHSELPKTPGLHCPGGLNRGWHSQCDPPVPSGTAVAKLNTASWHRAGMSQPPGHSPGPGAGVVPEQGMAQHGTAWNFVAQHGMARHSTVWSGVAWHSMAQHGTAWHITRATLALTETPPRDTSTSGLLQSHPGQALSSRAGR